MDILSKAVAIAYVIAFLTLLSLANYTLSGEHTEGSSDPCPDSDAYCAGYHAGVIDADSGYSWHEDR